MLFRQLYDSESSTYTYLLADLTLVLQIETEIIFIQFMNNLHLPDPKKMMEAVPANEQCGRKLATVE